MAMDPAAATKAYIDGLGAAELAKSRAYTTGNEWLMLADLVVAAIIAFLIVRSGVLDKAFGKLAQRGRFVRTFLVGALYLLFSAVLTLPWSIYTGWWRELQYGMTSQPLGDFLAQSGIALVIAALVGGLLIVGLYALIRRTGRLWWAWSGALVAAVIAFMLLLSPVLIEPLFNEFEPVPEGEVRDAVLVLSREAGIPDDRVFVYDGSRQSNNFTANVAGLGPNKRVAISDVALGEASLDEVRAVTGHEIGHYVLGHVWMRVLVFAGLSVLVFFLVARLYPRAARLFGTDAPIEDVRGLPVFAFVATLLFALATPLVNAVIRMGESQADDYSLEHVNLPDGLASALVKTAEFRYPRSGPVEEMLFYTHPSVEKRVLNAMEWKAANRPAGE